MTPSWAFSSEGTCEIARAGSGGSFMVRRSSTAVTGSSSMRVQCMNCRLDFPFAWQLIAQRSEPKEEHCRVRQVAGVHVD